MTNTTNTHASDKHLLLYGGKVSIDFLDDGHEYTVQGRNPISVTQVTGVIDKSRVLMMWALKLCRNHLLTNVDAIIKMGMENDIAGLKAIIMEANKQHTIRKDAAAEIGTRVHAWVEQYIKSTVAGRKKIELPTDTNVLNGVTAFMKWQREHKVKFIESEKPVYSLKHDFVGTCDAIALFEDQHRVIDFKTSSGIYPEMRLQVAAYQGAEEEEGSVLKKLKIKKFGPRIIVRFGKDTPDFEYREFAEQEKDYAAFLGALALKRRLKEIES